MPALGVPCSGTDSSCRDSQDEAKCSSLRALRALAVRGQQDLWCFRSCTGMEQEAGIIPPLPPWFILCEQGCFHQF